MPLNPAMQKNIGAYVTSRLALATVDVTAGGAGDATEANGEVIDRLVNGAGGPLLSAKLIIAYKAVLAATETLTIAANFRDDTDVGMATDVADYGDAYAAAVVATGEAGGSTEEGVVELDVSLAGARRYLQAQVTPTLSAAATDTARITAVLVLSGSDDYPAA